MNPFPDNFQKMIRNIAPRHCDFCGHKYSEEDFHLVKMQGQNAVVHLKCAQCNSSYMLNIYSPGTGVLGSSRMQLNLDLEDNQEITQFANNTAVTRNEALDAFNLLVEDPKIHELLNKKQLGKSLAN